MRVEFLTFCESAVQEGGTMSIVRAFNDLVVPGFPSIVHKLQVAGRLVFELDDAGNHNLTFSVRDTRGQLQSAVTVAAHLPTGLFLPIATMHLVLQVENIQIQSGGEHTMTLDLDGAEKYVAPFWVSTGKAKSQAT